MKPMTKKRSLWDFITGKKLADSAPVFTQQAYGLQPFPSGMETPKVAGIAENIKPALYQQNPAYTQTSTPVPYTAGGIPNFTASVMDQMKKRYGFGRVGTYNFGGYFQEELLPELKGRAAALVYDDMRRSDYQVAAILNQINNKIKAAKFFHEPDDPEDEEQMNIARFLDYCLFEDLDRGWFDTLNEFLSFLPYGYAAFEPQWKEGECDEFGRYWNFRTLGWRSPKTIWRWHIIDNKLWSLQQISYGDDSIMAEIPGSDLMILTNMKEGNNYEGISILRSSYGPWLRKMVYHQINAVGIERTALGMITVTVPKDMAGTQQNENLRQSLINYSLGNSAWVETPEGWTIEIKENKYNFQAVQDGIKQEDAAIAKSVQAEFIMLGETGVGARALAQPKIENFDTSLKYVVQSICDCWNNWAVPKLIEANFGKKDFKVKLKYSGIDIKASKEIADAFAELVTCKAIDPDTAFKKHVRKIYELPPIDEDDSYYAEQQAQKDMQTAAAQAKIDGMNKPQPQPGNDDKGKDGQFHEHKRLSERALTEYEKRINLSELKSRFDNLPADFNKRARESLTMMINKYKNDLKNKLSNATSVKAKMSVINNLELGYGSKYADIIMDWMVGVALQARQGAHKEVKGSTHALAEPVDINKLPSGLYGWVVTTSNAIQRSQQNKLRDKMTFAAVQSVQDGDTSDATVFDAGEAGVDYIANDNNIGGDILTAQTVNEGRYSMFQEYADSIQGFQYSAILDDSVCDLCESLDGNTFKIDDADATENQPPQHINCRCILAPILMDDDPPEEWDGLEPSPEMKDKYQTLKEHKHEY
jgi:hypothetical protein